MNKQLLGAMLIFLTNNSAAEVVDNNIMTFTPLQASAQKDKPSSGDLDKAPWEIPAGYTQIVIADETQLDIYKNISDWNDMNTVNETGKNAGRYLYRTHEVRPRKKLFGGLTKAQTIKNFKAAGGGAVSVVDLITGEARIVLQKSYWEAIDGILWTPWGSILVAEESNTQTIPDPALPKAKSGHVYEMMIDSDDPMNKNNTAKALFRPQLGALAHEGIEYDEKGNIYVIDEDFHGSIYKFVPKAYGDLSSGQLYVLNLKEDNAERTGSAEWLALDMRLAQLDAQAAATQVDATTWCRPEDLENIDETLYVALTCNKNSLLGQREENRVLSISLGKNPMVKNFVKAGVNAPEEDGKNPAGFAKPDNLAKSADGRLWIVEDNSPSEIWVASSDQDGDGYSDQVKLFASLADSKAEGTGIYFGKDPNKLFVNIQHSQTGNDKTMIISKQ